MKPACLAIAVVAACGGSESAGPDPDDRALAVTSARATELCMPPCEREVACNGDDLATCMTACIAQLTDRYRDDAAEALSTCTAALACGASDAACGQDIQPLPYHEVWETACRAKLLSCGADFEVFCEVSPDPTSDDVGTVRYFVPAVVDELLACLDLPTCDERSQCFIDVVL